MTELTEKRNRLMKILSSSFSNQQQASRIPHHTFAGAVPAGTPAGSGITASGAGLHHRPAGALSHLRAAALDLSRTGFGNPQLQHQR